MRGALEKRHTQNARAGEKVWSEEPTQTKPETQDAGEFYLGAGMSWKRTFWIPYARQSL